MASYADMVHSVDRYRLVTALSRRAGENDRVIRCLVQVSLDEDPAAAGSQGRAGRGGADPGQVLGLCGQIAAADGLELAGVMGVAPLGQPAEAGVTRGCGRWPEPCAPGTPERGSFRPG